MRKNHPSPSPRRGSGARRRHDIQTLVLDQDAPFLSRAQQQRNRGRWLDRTKMKDLRIQAMADWQGDGDARDPGKRWWI